MDAMWCFKNIRTLPAARHGLMVCAWLWLCVCVWVFVWTADDFDFDGLENSFEFYYRSVAFENRPYFYPTVLFCMLSSVQEICTRCHFHGHVCRLVLVLACCLSSLLLSVRVIVVVIISDNHGGSSSDILLKIHSINHRPRKQTVYPYAYRARNPIYK